MSIFTVPMTIRYTQRLGQIVSAMARHGFGTWVSQLRLRRHVPWSGRWLGRREVPDEQVAKASVGKRLVAFCEELGPTFVKLGQLLSSRPDLIPSDWMDDLRTLQDRVIAFPTPQAHRIIEADLGNPVAKLFAEFDPVPLASGSIAQTYRARTFDGCDVVVKVRRPGIDQLVRLDMHILTRLAESMEKYIPEVRLYQPTSVIDEFSQTIAREMDLLNEATVTERIHRFFANHSNVVTPAVRWDLTSNRVLTMTYLKGRSFNEALSDPDLPIQRRALARTLVDAFMQQYLELNVFNADPHPGNLIVIPPATIGIIDFGMAGQLDSKRCAYFIVLMTAATYRQMDLVMDLLATMNALTTATDVELLKRDLGALLDKYQALPLRYMNFQIVFNEMSALARKHHVSLPRDFVMMGKSLVNVGGAALQLDRDMNPNEVIRPRVRQALLKLFGCDNLGREALLGVWHGAMLVKDLPGMVRELSRKLLRGELKVVMGHEGLYELTRELDRSSNRISFAMVVAGIIVGSSLIVHARVGPTWFGGMPILGLTGYLVAAVMGLYLLIAIIRSGKLS